MKMIFHSTRKDPDKVLIEVGWAIETWPKPPPQPPEDDREKVVATERMWRDNFLAYKAGDMVPVVELSGLTTESQLGRRDARPGA